MANVWRKLDDRVPNEKSAGDDRLIMLCDGVFAIAITLLVLDIRIDDPTHFQENLPAFFGKVLFYFLTFFVIASYWVMHRRIMRQVRRLDQVFIWLTIVFLAFVALVPATTTIVNMFGSHAEADIIYVLSLVACGLSAAALWIYASWKHRLIDPLIEQGFIRFTIIDTLINPIYFLLSLLLLFIPQISDNPSHLFYSWLLLSVPNIIIHRANRVQIDKEQ